MSLFSKHDENSAPTEAAKVLLAAKERYGFVPNLAAYLAESPLALATVLKLSELFEQSTLTPEEQQLVLLTVSATNDCSYCQTAHTALGKKAGLSTDTLQSITTFKTLSNPRLEALRTFTVAILEHKGQVDEQKVEDFIKAGFAKAQVFEVVMGVTLKTMTNYSNHLAVAEPNAEFIEMAGDAMLA